VEMPEAGSREKDENGSRITQPTYSITPFATTIAYSFVLIIKDTVKYALSTLCPLVTEISNAEIINLWPVVSRIDRAKSIITSSYAILPWLYYALTMKLRHLLKP
jgi:hypothetical protein